jgi:hypothetical protein
MVPSAVVVIAAFAFVGFRWISELHGLRWMMSSRADRCLSEYLLVNGVEWTDFEESCGGHVGLTKRLKRKIGLDTWPPGPRRVANFLLWGWAAPVLGAAVCFVVPSSSTEWLNVTVLALALLCAVMAVSELATGIVKHLFLGPRQADLGGLRVKFSRENWWIRRQSLSNLSVLFLMLAAETTLSFGALYSSMYRLDAGVFQINRGDVTVVTWIYYSLATFTAVGFGDIHPQAWPSELATAVQLLTGPLALTWLLGEFRDAGKA